MTDSKLLGAITAMIDFQTNGSSTEQKGCSFVDVLELHWRAVPNMFIMRVRIIPTFILYIDIIDKQST
jgi:hypothetical protein